MSARRAPGPASQRSATAPRRRWLAALLLPIIALLCAASTARADVVVVQLPAAAAARGLPLQVGDILRDVDDSQALDVFQLLGLETIHAARGAVRLNRLRAGDVQAVELAAGRWDLIAAPLDGNGEGTLDLDAALAQAQASGNAERACALQLARARLAAGRGDFDTASAAFAAATMLLPAREAAIAHAQAQAFEQHPDRRLFLQAAERAVALQRSAATAPALLAANLQLLANARALTRDNPGALSAANDVLQLAPGSLTAANAHLLRSFVAVRSSDLSLAAAELDQAARIVAEIAPSGLDQAMLLARRAVLSALRREGDAATEAYSRALAQLRRLAPDSMALGRVAFNAQLHALERRRYAEAERLARESMTVFAAAAPNGLEFAQARAALSEVLMRRTEYAQAETLLRAASEASDALDARSYEALSLKLQLGDSLARQRRLEEALQLYTTVEQALDAADAPVALAATSLSADAALYRAGVLAQLDRCPEAMVSAEHALQRYIAQQRPGIQRWEAHMNLSECTRRLGNLPAAVDHAQQALAGIRAIAADGIQEALAQHALARAERDSGETTAAITAYRAAIDGLERHRAQVGGSDDIRARWAAQFQDFYLELAWLLAREALGGTGAAPSQTGAALPGTAEHIVELETRYREQSLLQLLGASEAELTDAWAAQGAVSETAARLPPDSALVSYLVGSKGTLAIVVRPGEPESQVVILPATRAALHTEVDRLLLLGARVSDEPAAITALQDAGHSLHAALIAPLQPLLDRYPRWVLVADGPLLRVPWAALVVQRDPLRYLVEDRVLSVAPSAPVWALLAQREPAADTILAFADPSGDGSDARLRDQPAGGLSGARREVTALAARFPGRVTHYVGAAATEAQVRAAAPRAGAIHFALHSVTDASEPMASHIVLANGGGLHSRDDGRLHADEIARELRLQADLVVLSSCASALGRDAGGEGLLGLIRALHLAGSRAVIGTAWPVADRSTARLIGDFYRHRSAGLGSDAALAAAQRDWLAAARAQGWQAALARFVGVDDALPAAAAQPFYWAGFIHSGPASR